MRSGVPTARSAWLAFLTLALTACAAAGSDVHLAPLYTRLSTADGGNLVEVAGGLYRQHRRQRDGFLEWRTLAPLYGIQRAREGDFVADHPVFLGRTRRTGKDTTSYLVPLYLGWRKEQSDGRQRGVLLTLPGLLLQKDGEELHGGWFPFFGRFRNLLTFDEASFALWPLYVHAERAERESHHFLWPFFGWTSGGGERSWHLFPLFARASFEGRYDRTYFLWPFFHWQANHLGGGGEAREDVWWVFPLVGHKQRGTYRSWSFLWPFFGFSHDPRSGFWALDLPFFLVRLQRGPEPETRRTRFWPFYSRLETAGLTWTQFLWPLGHSKHEDSLVAERDSKTLVPFWQSWDRRDKLTDERSSWRKLWPLLRLEREGDWRAGAVLELDPFFRNDVVPRYLTGFARLYEWEESPEFRRERALLGLYRRERGRGEDRRFLSGLWSDRRYESEAGAVRETSLLFGLLRWRVNSEGGFAMLRPAFPGPGWPRQAEAAPADESRTFF